jgi:hypothetical protein
MREWKGISANLTLHESRQITELHKIGEEMGAANLFCIWFFKNIIASRLKTMKKARQNTELHISGKDMGIWLYIYIQSSSARWDIWSKKNITASRLRQWKSLLPAYITEHQVYLHSAIDIRRLSRPPPPTPSTCDVMYTIDSTLLYIMVAGNRNTIWPPPPQISLHQRAALTTNSNGTQSEHKKKRKGGAV